MKKCIQLILYLIISLGGYSLMVPDGYVKYQTVDGYTLEGIKMSKIEEPYVMLKHMPDTIFVLFSRQRNGIPIKYINKGSYWHNFTIHDDHFCDRGYLCMFRFRPWCTEKFIFNDTILTYHYNKDIILNEIGSQSLTIDTRSNKIRIVFRGIINPDNKLDDLKGLIEQYNLKYPYYSPEYQSEGYYEEYTKLTREDTLFIHKKNSKENGCLYEVKKLGKLGEFDYENAESINVYGFEDKCKTMGI